MRDGLVAAVDPGRVGERVGLDVQVDPRHVVGGDQALEDRGDRLHAGAAVGDLGVGGVGGVAAERRDDVAAACLDRGDVAAEAGRGDRLRRCRRPSRPCRSRPSRSAGTPATGTWRPTAATVRPGRCWCRTSRSRGRRPGTAAAATAGRLSAGRGAGAGGGQAERDHGRSRGGQRCQQRGVSSHARIPLARRNGDQDNRPAAPGMASQLARNLCTKQIGNFPVCFDRDASPVGSRRQ